MAARERFQYSVQCPSCPANGMAEFTEEGGFGWIRDPRTEIERFPSGFEFISLGRTAFDCKFKCLKCETVFQNGKVFSQVQRINYGV
jgi:hypothetical protein